MMDVMEYSLKEVVAKTGVSARTIYRWTQKRLLPAKKNPRGYRIFTDDDIKLILELRSHGAFRRVPRTTIAVINNKGGVGKTTTVVNLAYEWQIIGYRVLAVDIDPQHSLTDAITSNERHISFYDYIRRRRSLEELIRKNDYFDALVSDLTMSELEFDEDRLSIFRTSLRSALQQLPQYNLVIIDTPPSLGIFTQMAMFAADYIVIPVQSSYLAMEGMSNLWNKLNTMRESEQLNIDILGIVVTMFRKQESMSTAVLEMLRDERRDLVCENVIRHNRALDNAQSAQMPVSAYSSRSFGAVDYENLAIELVSRVRTNADRSDQE